MTSPATLLPSNSGLYEKAVAESIEIDPAVLAPIGTMADPLRIPASALPHLAWGWSTDYWRDGWPEHRKRQVVLEQPAFHRLKGTIAADRMACDYADAELINYHLPRDGFMIGRSPTPEAYEAWLRALPEIRIYPLPPRATKSPPLGGAVGRHPVFRGSPVPQARRAELRKGDQVVALVVSGETFDPDGQALAEIERVSVPAPPEITLAAGRGKFSRPIGKPASTRRVFDFDWRPTSRDPFDLKPGVPSLVPAEAHPRIVPISRPSRGWRVAVGRTSMGGAVSPAPARADFYLALRVADGTGPSGSRPRTGSVGRSRMPRAPFTKELAVLVARPSKRGFPFSGRRIAPDPAAKTKDVLSAIASAQSARDVVTVNFNVVRELTVADLNDIDETTRIGAVKLMSRR
ncbi:phage tail protein I [Shinella sp. DD12]|uniref:phage tail protein I n=1 Tax=Shinella sp. DD12 TaxID=1410620 RepID=UPI0003C53CC8|nr:phage tail protein I [Shinella sp. DD12]EYR81878.1 phage tail protein I [Shinella sp. DD12]